MTGPVQPPPASSQAAGHNEPAPPPLSDDTTPRVLAGPPTITLTATETQICALLQEVVERIHQQAPATPRLVLRIAGGWVRDKLLGLSSHDIDIAIDHMSGFELAQHVTQYLAESGATARSVAKIASNPERSKHLETATTVVLGQMVDFVNLRSETYNAESRVPLVEYGTPLEDAMRRDITINALFYNIGERRVEDWTQRGLEDLRRGLVRTPMEPRQTFEDDPLRVLRVVRFASRFGYAVDGPTAEALGLADVRRALGAKISRERVGAEVALMAAGPRPLVAIRLLIAHGLYPAVFRAPDTLPAAADVLPADVAQRLTHEVLALLDTPRLAGCLPLADLAGGVDEARRVLALAAYLYPFHAARVADGRRQTPVAAALVVMRDALKMSNHDMDTVVALHALAPAVAATAADIGRDPAAVSRAHLGLEIRRAARLWPLAVVFAAAVDMLPVEGVSGAPMAEAVVEKYVGYVGCVGERGLERAFEIKHLVDGRRAADILGVRPGPVIRQVLDRVLVWQLDHPEGTREQCEAFVRDAGLPFVPA
ncbi:CCA tRNA nucleotidyltransferase, mitochondrial [Coemansia erecta]|uniref:CCA tRNA nucleotidyltransferase, mitochondrial n=1 Tax=Coemansia erecta TaxID=147472 RepID=A0A9W7Y2H0_9FUNG|nr:CCA tRNA nucleotidyltransferase, mitochondrial [Coemansia erecta]